MSIPTFDPRRREAIRDGLVNLPIRRRRRLPVWGAIAAFAVAGAITGGAVSAAAIGLRSSPQDSPFTIGSAPGLRGIPAPPGTQPGAPVISLLGSAETHEVHEDGSIGLSGIPTAATNIRVTVTCLQVGELSWGLDPSGNNPQSTCNAADLNTQSATTGYDFSLTGVPSVYVNTSTSWVLTIQYLREIETAWGVNAHGQTFGVEKAGAGSPELEAVQGETASGAPVDGYALAEQLQTPPGTHEPTSPADALAQQKRLASEYPDGIPVPVYKSDGTTRIGTFYVGGH